MTRVSTMLEHTTVPKDPTYQPTHLVDPDITDDFKYGLEQCYSTTVP